MLRTLRTLAAAAAVGLGGSARAAPPAVTSDVALARSALAAVDADPLLGPGVIVSVKDRVAVVGGPVRSAEAVGRAEAVVRTVPGIAEVRNACYVQPAGDPLIRPVRDWPSLMTPRRLMADLPVFLRHPRPEAATDPDPTGAAPAERTMVALRPAAPAVNVLLPPVPAAGSVPPPAPPPPGVLTGRP
ncbi:MAG: BON domain-containing protein, partial [Gemmataceae bacterium]|nr:BON domain-containing protein [Gemmataceae bacterium]